jgi:hypothetical protein
MESRLPNPNSQNTACVCASAVYASNFTQCTESNCGFSASDVQHALTSNCANGVCNFASGDSWLMRPYSNRFPARLPARDPHPRNQANRLRIHRSQLVVAPESPLFSPLASPCMRSWHDNHQGQWVPWPQDPATSCGSTYYNLDTCRHNICDVLSCGTRKGKSRFESKFPAASEDQGSLWWKLASVIFINVAPCSGVAVISLHR